MVELSPGDEIAVAAPASLTAGPSTVPGRVSALARERRAGTQEQHDGLSCDRTGGISPTADLHVDMDSRSFVYILAS